MTPRQTDILHRILTASAERAGIRKPFAGWAWPICGLHGRQELINEAEADLRLNSRTIGDQGMPVWRVENAPSLSRELWPEHLGVDQILVAIIPVGEAR